jgi:lipopolysaccharide cholinephosphotransferase
LKLSKHLDQEKIKGENKLDEDTLVKLRCVMLEILDEFVRICDENNLVYFLFFGTLLGAVRHKGFIPWDDDIDVAMPRNDYEKFIDIISCNKKSNYYVLSHKSPVNTYYHYRDFTRFCKKRTIYAQENKKTVREYSGIFIDIWPYDNCILPLAYLQKMLISLTLKLYRLKTHEDIPQKKYKYFIIRIIILFFPLKYLKTLRKKSSVLFNKYNTKYIVFLSAFNKIKKNIFKNDKIFPLTKLFFEGKQYWVPGDYHACLEYYYGNYMELPPVEQRVTHGVDFIEFDDPEMSIEKIYKIHE